MIKMENQEKESDRRFIEKYLPIWELNDTASSERGFSPSQIATVHRWWARRRQGVSRATILACLLNETLEHFDEIKELIAAMGDHNNRNDPDLLKKARDLISQDRGTDQI